MTWRWMYAFAGWVLLFLITFVRPYQLRHLLSLPSGLIFMTCQLFFIIILDSKFIRRILYILTDINRHLWFIICFWLFGNSRVPTGRSDPKLSFTFIPPRFQNHGRHISSLDFLVRLVLWRRQVIFNARTWIIKILNFLLTAVVSIINLMYFANQLLFFLLWRFSVRCRSWDRKK